MNLPLPHNPAEFIGTIPVALSAIAPSPTNPREHFDETAMAELTESVRRLGVMQPILIRPWPAEYAHAEPRPHYELVAGERRWRAAKAAGLTTIEAKAQDLSDNEVIEMQLIENLQRKDLHPLEEAIGYERAIKEYGYTADKLAENINKSKAYIYARIKLTALCHEARKAFSAGKLNPSTALLIARIPNDSLQAKATREITDPDHRGEAMSVRAAQQHLQQRYMLRLLDAPFLTYDPLLIKKAGSCEHCPKRTGNQPADLFADIASADVCTDPDCYSEKRQAHVNSLAARATANGHTVITGAAAEKIMPYGDPYSMKGGLVSIDRTCYEDKKQRTYREILGNNLPEIQLIENTRTSKLVEAVPDKQLAMALKAAGVTSGHGIGGNRDTADEKKARVERTYRKRLLERVRTAILKDFADNGPQLETEELALVAETLFQRTEWECRRGVVRLWDSESKKIDHDQVNAFVKRIPTLSTGDLYLLLLDCVLIGETQPNAYSFQNEPETLLEFAQNSGIDPAEIKAELAAEASRKASPPTKAAQAGEPTARETKAEAVAPKVGEAASDGGDLKAGDRVRIKNGLRGPSGNLRKCCGREGVIDEVHGAYFTVRTAPGANGLIANLTWNELDKLPPAPKPAAPAVVDIALKVGDRVRIKDGLKSLSGRLRTYCGQEGTVEAVSGPWIDVRTTPGAKGLIRSISKTDLEKLPDVTQAAPAAGQNPKNPKQAAPAAPKAKAKNSVRASPAERKPVKSVEVMNEKAVAL